MAAYIALLRAVNVGGTGKLPMTELKAMCFAEGWTDARTYIASGNVVFTAKAKPAAVKKALEARLEAYAGKPVGVHVRTAEEMAAVRDADPFPDAPGNRVAALFLDAPPPADALDAARGRTNEELRLGAREIYVYYPDGQADTKLVIPAAKAATGRNMNTVTKLADMAAAL